MSKPWLGEYQLFSARHGRSTQGFNLDKPGPLTPEEHWPVRHRLSAAMVQVLHGVLPEQARCMCKQGVDTRTTAELMASEPLDHDLACQCSQLPTQEDGLCDECRVWCIVTDGAGNLFQGTTGRPAEIGRAATPGYVEKPRLPFFEGVVYPRLTG